MSNTILIPDRPVMQPTVTPSQLAAQQLAAGWFQGVLDKIARSGNIYYPLNRSEIVPSGDGTVAQTPRELMSRTSRSLQTEAKQAVGQNAVKRFFGGVVAAAGTDLTVTCGQRAFGWRIRISSDVLTWNFGMFKLKLTYEGQDRVIYVAPLEGSKYCDIVALAFSDNAGKGVLVGPTTMTLTLYNPATPSDSPGTIPSKTAISVETLNVRDLGTDF